MVYLPPSPRPALEPGPGDGGGASRKMYKFLMVDDEELVRRGFESRIDWAGAGFEFLPPCENGREAMKAIEELRPDVVMTDICMPFSDGIAVAAFVAERYPEIVVVVLSGYDEFRYAQEAIRNKVFDYVLKPVSSRDLYALLLKVKGKLEADRQVSADESALKERADRSGDLLRERSLADFLAGTAARPSVADFSTLFGFDPEGLACTAMIAERDAVDGPGEGDAVVGGKGALELSFQDRFAAAFASGPRAIVFYPRDGRAAALVFERGSENCASKASFYAGRLLAPGQGPVLRVGIGRTYGAWLDAPRSYDEASSALAYRLVRGPERPFNYLQSADEDPAAIGSFRALEEKICLCLKAGAADQAPGLTLAFLDTLATAGLSPQRVRHEVLALFARALDELASVGISPATVAAGIGEDYYSFAESQGRPEDIAAALKRLAALAATSLGTRGMHLPEWKILDFKEYVERHYRDPKLSIARTAEGLSISESYLSKLLRRHIGRSFVDYLTEFRVVRARELLASTDLLTYEVAEGVGFADARYFSTVFKRLSGSSPSEYRSALRDGGVKA